jgi:hypothetical protein
MAESYLVRKGGGSPEIENGVNVNNPILLTSRESSNILYNRFSGTIDVNDDFILFGLGENSGTGAFFNTKTLDFVNTGTWDGYSTYSLQRQRFINNNFYIGWNSSGQKLYRATPQHTITHFSENLFVQPEDLVVDDQPENTGKIFAWEGATNANIKVYRKNNLAFLYNMTIPVNHGITQVQYVDNKLYISAFNVATGQTRTRFLYEYNTINNQASSPILRISNVNAHEIKVTNNFVYYPERQNGADYYGGLHNLVILYRSNYAVKQNLNVRYSATRDYNSATVIRRTSNEDYAIFRGTLTTGNSLTNNPINNAFIWSVYDMQNNKYLVNRYSQSGMDLQTTHNNRLYWTITKSSAHSLIVQPLNLEKVVIKNNTYYKL